MQAMQPEIPEQAGEKLANLKQGKKGPLTYLPFAGLREALAQASK